MTSDISNPSDEVQSDKDIYELIKKINPTNYQDSSKVYLIKDVINNITSVLPIFLSRSLIMQQETIDEKSDWNNLQPNSMQVFLSTSGLNAPYLASTNNTGIVFTFNLKTDEIDKMYQLAFSVGDNISFAIRGKDTDLDGAEWHYTPNVVDYDTFKGAVNDKLNDMYSKFVTGMDAYKPENLEPIIEKADKMVQDATNNAQISVDGFKADITQKVNDTLAQLKTVQDSANKLQSQVTDFSNQKIQEINNNYDSQLKDLEKTYVADVQSYITQVNKAQATLDDISKTVSSLDISKLVDLSDYYTKEDVNKVIANTLSGYITSTAVDTKISNAISPLQTQVNAKQDKIGYTPADDSKVVHNSGNETIGGTKTFTNPIKGTIDGITYQYSAVGDDLNTSYMNDSVIYTGGNSVAHAPAGTDGTWAIIRNYNSNATNGAQSYYDTNHGVLYVRTRNSTSTYTPWTEAGAGGASDKYTGVKEVTQAEYDALTTKDPNTIYYIWLS